MCSIHIGICHDHDLIIAKFRDVKVISIPFRESAAECIDHGLDFRIGKYFINGCFLYVQDLTSDRQDCLIITVTGSLGRTTGRISLYDEDLTLGRIFLLAVRQLSIGIKGIFLFGQKIDLGSLFCLANLGSFLCTGEDCLKSFQISVEIEYHLLSHNLTGCTGCILVVQLRFGLTLESWFRMLNGNDRCHSVTDICTCEIRIFILQNTDLSGISIHHCGKCSLKSSQMSTALCIINVITEAQHILTELIGKLKCHFHLNAVRFPLQINRLMENFRTVVQILDKSDDAIRFMIGNIFNLLSSFILEVNGQFRIQVCSLMKPALYLCC